MDIKTGDTVALDTPTGPCGMVTAINPATSDEVAVRWASRWSEGERGETWIRISRLVRPNYDHGL